MISSLVLLMALLLLWKGIFYLAKPLGSLPATLVSYVWVLAVTVVFLLQGRLEVVRLLRTFSIHYLVTGVLWGVGLFVAGAAGYVISQRILGLRMPENAQNFFGAQLVGQWVLVLATTILAVIAEELAFRGLLLMGLRTILPTAYAALLSAVAFAAFHLSPFQLLSTTIYGVGLALLTISSNNLWPALIAHLTLNSLGVLMFALKIIHTRPAQDKTDPAP